MQGRAQPPLDPRSTSAREPPPEGTPAKGGTVNDPSLELRRQLAVDRSVSLRRSGKASLAGRRRRGRTARPARGSRSPWQAAVRILAALGITKRGAGPKTAGRSSS